MAFDKKKIGAFWERVSKTGTPYLSGVLEIGGRKYKVIAFRNNKKEKDTQPDWQVYDSEEQIDPKVSSEEAAYDAANAKGRTDVGF